MNRCDRCGGKPKVQVILPSGLDLLLCDKHTRQHQSVLTGRYPVMPLAGAL